VLDMSGNGRVETPSTGDSGELQHEIAERSLARAKMHAERDDHVRNALRAAIVRDGLQLLSSELNELACEREAAHELARRECIRTANELADRTRAASACDADVRELSARLAVERDRQSLLERERVAAQERATLAEEAEATARARYDETTRSATELKAKYAAAEADAASAAERSRHFVALAQTLDREHMAAESALAAMRTRTEMSHLEADVERIRTVEMRLAAERELLEERLRDCKLGGGSLVRIALARRLGRDLGA